MDEKISNERLFLEVRKNHRRLIGAIGLITAENFLVIGVLGDFISAVEGAALIGFVLLLALLMGQGMRNGGVWGRLSAKLPLMDPPEPEPQVKQRLGEE